MHTSDLYINKSTGAAFTFNASGVRVDIAQEDPDIQVLFQACRQSKSGDFHLSSLGRDYRVSTIETVEYDAYILRFHDSRFTSMRDLSLHVKVVERLLSLQSGLLLICGSFGQGKSTLARCLLRDSVHRGGLGVCLEDPPELMMQGPWGDGYIYQTEVAEGCVSSAIRKATRYRAKVIFVGEIRDTECAVATLQIALSGALVIATSHGGSIPEAIVRIHSLASSRMNSNDAANLLADGLSAVLHQKFDNNQIKATLLSVPGNDKVRTILRNKSFDQLNSEIDAQRIKLFLDDGRTADPFVTNGYDRRKMRG
jgi:Tfp pilus assembly pilus retraction ATPase PilT